MITYIDDQHYKKLLLIQKDDYIKGGQSKVLIDKGIVKQYINTMRSESYKYLSATRMSNSYLKPNSMATIFDLKKVKNGIYIYKIGSGKLYLEQLKFEVIIDAGYLVRDGKIFGNISNLSFIVDIPNFIRNIKYIGNDLNFVPTVCGASSGNIFAYAGTPTVYVEKIFIEQRQN